MAGTKLTSMNHFLEAACAILLLLILQICTPSAEAASDFYNRRAAAEKELRDAKIDATSQYFEERALAENNNDDDGGDEVGAAPCGDMMRLLPCLAAITGSKPPAPTSQCCKIVVTLSEVCICALLSVPTTGFDINVPVAMTLPTLCQKPLPKGFSCAAGYGSYFLLLSIS
ncbi:hypothetical protein AXG93_3444s1100 [Marchantia polymorpha subsp. ruderalis]|uniref:Bifunctional inhibitor/plant lipid transfer protein/seed storage helical domain-containing protein n=1 Tax=Marchantia polymorpha subsp. ruderalis TaxID=1480154 RepID=A0A176VZF2_MARPO|nr:hypothetical protein AXG93_3444s1100 [Marchantia polymorpha subsp. ruderalis]